MVGAVEVVTAQIVLSNDDVFEASAQLWVPK